MIEESLNSSANRYVFIEILAFFFSNLITRCYFSENIEQIRVQRHAFIILGYRLGLPIGNGLLFLFFYQNHTGILMANQNFDSVEAQASYGIGLQVGQQLLESGLEGLKPEAILAGLTDALEGNMPSVPVEALHNALREIHERADAVRVSRQEELAAEGQVFLEENQKREGVSTTESGLQFSVINQGEGAIPARTDRVRVHYTGRLVDGTVFDSSVQRGQPAEFPVNGVIPGWIEALTLMPVGSKWELYIPSELAYGERGAGASIPPFSTLVFEVELLDIL